jgi:hypothetical protein
MHVLPIVVLLIAGCGVAAYWRLPDLRHRTEKMLPAILLAIGVLGLVLALPTASYGAQGVVDGRAESWRAAVVLQSVAFLAAGLWVVLGADAARLRLACCASRSPTTAQGARTRPRAPGWQELSAGSVHSTASWP